MGKIIICEDDTAQAAHLRQLLSDMEPWCNWEVQTVSGVEELSNEAVLQNTDIILMDICLGRESGINAVARIQTSHPEIGIIYVTGHTEYCSDVYDTQHSGFLLKPVDPLKLRQALRRTQRSLPSGRQALVIEQPNRIWDLPLEEILLFEKQLRKIKVITQNEEIDIYGRFSDFQPQLDGRFIQCHASYLVNMDHVESFSREEFILPNGRKIPISRRRGPTVRNAFLAHLHKRNVC